jgi:NAD(P)H dehydrogenase (quinone)
MEVSLFQVPQLVPAYALEKSGEAAVKKAFAHTPLAKVDQLGEADAIIFGTPTRYGNMCAKMRNFMDQTGGQWMKYALVDKDGSVFASTATQHGG